MVSNLAATSELALAPENTSRVSTRVLNNEDDMESLNGSMSGAAFDDFTDRQVYTEQDE